MDMKKITIDFQDKNITQIGKQTTIDYYHHFAIAEKKILRYLLSSQDLILLILI